MLKKATKSQSIHRTRSAAIVQLGSREMALRSVITMSDVRNLKQMKHIAMDELPVLSGHTLK